MGEEKLALTGTMGGNGGNGEAKMGIITKNGGRGWGKMGGIGEKK